jgi:hypothetical protein
MKGGFHPVGFRLREFYALALGASLLGACGTDAQGNPVASGGSGSSGASGGGNSAAGSSAGGIAGTSGVGGAGAESTAGTAGSAAGGNASGGAGDAGWCRSDLTFCDDFESAEAGGPPGSAWEVFTWNDGSVEIDGAAAIEGERSLKLTTPNHAGTAYARHTASFPVAGNAFYGRLLFLVEAPGPKAFVHWNLVEATGPDTATESTKLIRYGGVSIWEEDGSKFIFNRWLFNFEMQPRPGGFTEFGSEDDVSPAFDWGTTRCMEWMFDAPGKEVRLWVDSMAVDLAGAKDAIGDRALDLPAFDGLNVGWATYQDEVDAGYTVWVDAVAIDDERIGCE